MTNYFIIIVVTTANRRIASYHILHKT